MDATRRARLESVLLDELSQMVRREIKDPRIPALTFTQAQVTQDGSQATMRVMLLGGAGPAPARPEATDPVDAHQRYEQEHREWLESYQTRMKQCLEGLDSASGFLRRHLAKVLNIKHIPQLIFKEDKGLENSNRVFELLKEVGPSRSSESS